MHQVTLRRCQTGQSECFQLFNSLHPICLYTPLFLSSLLTAMSPKVEPGLLSDNKSFEHLIISIRCFFQNICIDIGINMWRWILILWPQINQCVGNTEKILKHSLWMCSRSVEISWVDGPSMRPRRQLLLKEWGHRPPLTVVWVVAFTPVFPAVHLRSDSTETDVNTRSEQDPFILLTVFAGFC